VAYAKTNIDICQFQPAVAVAVADTAPAVTMALRFRRNLFATSIEVQTYFASALSAALLTL